VGLNPTEDRTKIYKKCQLILLTLLLLNGMLRRVRLYKKMLNTNWGSSEEDRGVRFIIFMSSLYMSCKQNVFKIKEAYEKISHQ
jgi:hypothetical protein